ncbi:MAG TPA: hypothetical protein VGA10_13255, partial [Thermoanaerobaculia bacterium]
MIRQDEELDRLEEDIRKVKNKYDQFFAGITKMPPQHERHLVEIFIHEIGKQKMREREEGPLDFRRRKAALDEPTAPPPPPRPTAPRVTSSNSDSYVKLVPGANGEAIRDLYSQIEKEHQKLGKAPNVTFEQLRSMVEKQSET